MLTAYLTAVGVLCGLTGLLALVIVLADATIADYGERVIVINDERRLVVDGGKPLLSSLKSEQIFIPSACGGRGSCGLCKCTVTEGGGDLLPTELPWLSPAEIKGGVRLSCQLKVKRDMALRIPEELFKVRQFTTRVSALQELTHDLKLVTLELVDPPVIDFLAGQFVQVEVPSYELSDEPVYRAYSIASRPTADCGTLQLEIKLVPEGICTTYVHQYLKVGDSLTINGPYGEFYLRPGTCEILCIATGSGMAPIRSILQQMAHDGVARRTRYFFGARHGGDLFQVDEMKGLETTLPDFTFVPVLSRPAPEDGWTGETGRVTDLCERLVDQGADLDVYLCGSPTVIDSCLAVLARKGVPAERCHYDKFS